MITEDRTFMNYKLIDKLQAKQFALYVSFLNALSFGLLVFSITYVDSHFSHIVYGVRYYPLGYSVCLFSILIFIFTYFSNSRHKSIIAKSTLTFLSMMSVIVIVSIINFRPEIPHRSLTFVSLASSIIISGIVYVHNYRPGFDFINEEKIAKEAKIERIKLEYETWFRLLVAAIAAYAVGAYQSYTFFPENAAMITKNNTDLLLIADTLGNALALETVLAFLLFIEILRYIYYVESKLTKIHEISNIDDFGM